MYWKKKNYIFYKKKKKNIFVEKKKNIFIKKKKKKQPVNNAILGYGYWDLNFFIA